MQKDGISNKEIGKVLFNNSNNFYKECKKMDLAIKKLKKYFSIIQITFLNNPKITSH